MDSSRSRVLILDESIQRNVIVVGGFITTADRLQALAEEWRELKEHVFGVDPSAELKYTMGAEHPARGALDAAGWSQARRVPAMLEHVANTDVLVLADALVDVRPEVHPTQLYLDGFTWCIRRAQLEVGDDTEGPHWVVVDMPPQAGELEADRVSERMREMHRHAGTAAFDRYDHLYRTREYYQVGRADPLRDVGFAPSLLASHARHSDLVQIADVVVGCVRDFVVYNTQGAGGGAHLPASDYREENLRVLGPRFRKSWQGQVVGYGFDIFPPPPDVACGFEVRRRVHEVCGS